MEFLTKFPCGLCEAAHPIVRRVARIARVDLIVTDVSTSDELFDLYEHRIPVVLGHNREVLAEGSVAFWSLLRSVFSARFRRRNRSARY